MKNYNVVRAALAALLCALALGTAQAASCTITSAGGVVFPAYDVASAVPTTAAPVMTFSCTGSSGTATVSIGASSVSGSIPSRQMKHATLTDRLNYNLYTTSGYTTVFGTTASGGAVTIANTKAAETVTVYGRIPAGQDVTIGAYSDTVTLSISP